MVVYVLHETREIPAVFESYGAFGQRLLITDQNGATAARQLNMLPSLDRSLMREPGCFKKHIGAAKLQGSCDGAQVESGRQVIEVWPRVRETLKIPVLGPTPNNNTTFAY